MSNHFSAPTHETTIGDDEEFARLLQYQEQSQPVSLAQVHQIDAGNNYQSEQERCDRELAHRVARSDLQASGHSSANFQQIPSPLRQSARARSQSTDSGTRRTSEAVVYPNVLLPQDHKGTFQAHARNIYVPSTQNSVVQDDSRHDTSLQDSLHYARMLQEHAFSNLYRKSDLSAERGNDLELARMMQQLEDSGMGTINSERRLPVTERTDEQTFLALTPRLGHTSARMPQNGQSKRLESSDERLARFLEATGESMRNLTEEQVNDLLQDSNEKRIRTRSLSPVPHDESNNHTLVREGWGNHLSTVVVASKAAASLSDNSAAKKPSAPPNPHVSPQRSSRVPPTNSVSFNSPRTPNIMPTNQAAALECKDHVKSAPTSPSRQIGRDVLASSIEMFNPIHDYMNHSTAAYSAPANLKERKSKKLFKFGRRRYDAFEKPQPESARKMPPGAPLNPPVDIPPPPAPSLGLGILRAIPPPPPGGRVVASAQASLFSNSGRVSSNGRNVTVPGHIMSAPRTTQLGRRLSQIRGSSVCYQCGQMGGTFVRALDRTYHTGCFRCVSCHDQIDTDHPFSFSQDANGAKRAHHPKCYAEMFGVTCTVCKESIPANPDGTVSYVKHPFFVTEQMCPRHVDDHNRRCTGCHRFEPLDEPFADLLDGDRCVCYACCRSVVVDSAEVALLWNKVLHFFEYKLGLPVWEGMRDIPVLVVGYEALNDQMSLGASAHDGASQIMTRALCLTDHEHGRAPLRLPSLRYDQSSGSFRSTDEYTYFELPKSNKSNASSNVVAILCLSGLPQDLTASILAHEATHAWVKLHPKHKIRKPLPAQVEEGVAQLVALLFLNDGLDPICAENLGGGGPSDGKLRQYFKYSIETDDNEFTALAIAVRPWRIAALVLKL